MNTFWDTLPAKILGLSPMDGVTDQPYRHIQKKYGKPNLIYTEFTSVEGVCHGATQLLKDFLYDESQRPIIGQIYGTTPEFFRETATLLCQLGFDGIDINMGCPAKNVAHSGAGAALILTPKLAQEIIKETLAGIEDWKNGKKASDCKHINQAISDEVEKRHSNLPELFKNPRSIPVSVKTRVGYDAPIVEEWLPILLEMNPKAIAIHGRTLKQQYSGLANWDEIGKAVEIAKNTSTKILGNGDIDSYQNALEKIETYNLSGVLIGRASFGNPYIFLPTPPDSPTIFEIALEHCRIYEETYSKREKYSFMPMRKHLGWYVRSIPQAREIRSELFQTESTIEVEKIFKKYALVK